MDDDVDLAGVAGKEVFQVVGTDQVGDVARGDVPPAVVVIEPVADHHVRPVGEVGHEVGPDEPGAAGDQDDRRSRHGQPSAASAESMASMTRPGSRTCGNTAASSSDEPAGK